MADEAPLLPTWRTLSAESPIPFAPKLNHIHRTWARTHLSRPELYLQPSTLPEIQQIVNFARTLRKKIITVGSGHSPSDITTAPATQSIGGSAGGKADVWLVNLDNFNKVISRDDSTLRITVEAGIRIHQLIKELDAIGWGMPNLGSITEQSLAGAIATGTHGSSLRHGLLSENVVGLTIVLADGKAYETTKYQNPQLYEAALVGLGGLGIVTHIIFQAVPAYNLTWVQEIATIDTMLQRWQAGLWTDKEYARVWWFPYARRTIIWRADKATPAEVQDAISGKTQPAPKTWFDTPIGYHIYQFFLYASTWFPAITPPLERLVFMTQYGWDEGQISSATQKGEEALLLNCLFSQFVNEWAIPLRNGPEFIGRLQAWLEHQDFDAHRIPVDNKGVYVHAPIEVRVADSSRNRVEHYTSSGVRGLLDPSCEHEPTLYINATIYRPYLADVGGRARYYRAFEWLAREFHGRPHWAKNFIIGGGGEVSDAASKIVIEGEQKGGDAWEDLYGLGLRRWRVVRRRVDREGVFRNGWLERVVLGGERPEGHREREEDREQGGFELRAVGE
ncbi:D-arabinono-1,4-lactone oxidase-domain-containing protein [Peziza echinospora]|nr:D-arabinono-1,4-lactone oxidase-domain-containing protein [Peziza echinospora]